MTSLCWLGVWVLAQVGLCWWWSRHQAQRKRYHAALMRRLMEEGPEGPERN